MTSMKLGTKVTSVYNVGINLEVYSDICTASQGLLWSKSVLELLAYSKYNAQPVPRIINSFHSTDKRKK